MKIGIVIPVYNEAAVIERVIRDFYEKVVRKIPGTTLTVAEDGSTDGTKEILAGLNKEIPFTLISAAARKGYTAAFKNALGAIAADWVFFSDSDGQHEPADLFKLLTEIDTNDIVSGYKQTRHDPLYRLVISKAYNLLIRALFRLKLKDIDSGFKLIKKSVIVAVLPEVGKFRHCVMSEFILRAHIKGYRVKEVAVIHYPRASGESAIFSPAKLPHIVWGLLKNLLELRFSGIAK